MAMPRLVLLSLLSSLSLVPGLFSGYYSAKENEDYGGAFLITTKKLISLQKLIEHVWFPEGLILELVKPNQHCPQCQTIFTRDYFDFSCDHLSSTTNIIGTMPMETQKKIIKYLNFRLAQTVKNIRDSIPSPPSSTTSSSAISSIHSSHNVTYRKSIVAIIPFSQEIANPGSLHNEYVKLHQLMRQHFFQATFYSLYRYFPDNIIVYVASDHDRELIESWNLPIKKIIVMDSILSQVPPEKYFFHDNQRKEPRPRNQLLPKYSLLAAVESLISDPSWSEYRYVYYTEGDQILHLRKLKHLLRALDARNGKDALIPHRMQTLPLFQNIPSAISEGWNYQKLPDVHLITETNLAELTGSCCDNARFDFPDCGNWWYYCQEWGLKNHTVWLQYGLHGFPMPLSTEHQGICSYSPTQVLCEMPKLRCEGRNKNRYNTSLLCGEVEFSLKRQQSYSSLGGNSKSATGHRRDDH